MNRINCILAAFLLFVACDDGPKEEIIVTNEQENSAANIRTIDLSPHDMPFVVQLDQAMVGSDSASVHWNEEFGRLEVEAGPRFRITIMEEEGDLSRLKASLDRDLLRQNTIIEETPELVIYRSQFPDEDIVFVHFYRIMRHEGRSFVIESNDQGRFNEDDVKRMVVSIKPADQV